MYQWPRWLMRKNPWYSWSLVVAQISIAAVLVRDGKIVWALFTAYAAGFNTVMAMYPENAPDSI